MDHNLIVPIEIKQKVELCVIRTNVVVSRWITNNGVNPKNITSDEVRGIFLGYVRKELFRNPEWRDYRRLSKILNVCLSDSNRLIMTGIYGGLELIYYSQNGYIEALCKAIDSIDYISLQDNKELTKQELTTIELDFSSIKNITF